MINYCQTTFQVCLFCWHEKSNSSRKDVKCSRGKEQRQKEEKQNIRKRYWMAVRPFWVLVLLCKAPEVWQGKCCQSRPQMEPQRLSVVLWRLSTAPRENNALQLVRRKITAMLSTKMSSIFYHYYHNLHTCLNFLEPFQLTQRRKANWLCKKAFVCTDAF